MALNRYCSADPYDSKRTAAWRPALFHLGLAAGEDSEVGGESSKREKGRE